MAVIVGILYFIVLSLALTYAVGGLGLGIAIFLLLSWMAISELVKIRREETIHADHKHMDSHGHT